MKKTKKFVSINLASLIISIFTVLIYFLANAIIEISTNGEFVSTIVFGIFEIVCIPFINIILINNFIDKKFDFKDNKLKNLKSLYFKSVGITFTTMLISHFITFILLNFAHLNFFCQVFASLISYMTKMFLSFALIIGVISEKNIRESIAESMKFTYKNIWKVIAYNIVFLIALWSINFVTKIVVDNFENLFAYFFASFFIEIVNCTILVTNMKIYLKNFKEKADVKEAIEN